MAFTTKEFMAKRLVPREAVIPVPDLKDYFENGDKPEWTVRGISGQELGRANNAAERNKELKAVLEGLLSKNSRRITQAIKKLSSPEITPDIAKRIALFQYGSVSPAVDEEFAVKFCKEFPIEFFELTNKILELTGKGHIPGEQKPSGTTTK